MSAGYALLQRFVRDVSGISLDDDKRYLVENRLAPILRDGKISGLDELAQRLHGNRHSDLAYAVAETLTINETSFFRDRTLFAAVSNQLLPRLLEARKDSRKLRIWCAGCATGQEPYSLAMVIDEMTRRLSGWLVEIVATDLSRPVVEFARRGRYSQFEVQRGLPVSMLLRHFARVDDGWQINDDLRAKISFRTQNLMTIPRDMGSFDIIFCRNVLFYFDGETKRRVLARLSGFLAEDGFLALGGGERIGALNEDLQADRETPFVFARAAPAPAAGRSARR